MWTAQIIDQTARSVQSDLDQHSSQKLFVSASVRKEYSDRKLDLQLRGIDIDSNFSLTISFARAKQGMTERRQRYSFVALHTVKKNEK